MRTNIIQFLFLLNSHFHVITSNEYILCFYIILFDIVVHILKPVILRLCRRIRP